MQIQAFINISLYRTELIKKLKKSWDVLNAVSSHLGCCRVKFLWGIRFYKLFIDPRKLCWLLSLRKQQEMLSLWEGIACVSSFPGAGVYPQGLGSQFAQCLWWKSNAAPSLDIERILDRMMGKVCCQYQGFVYCTPTERDKDVLEYCCNRKKYVISSYWRMFVTLLLRMDWFQFVIFLDY